MDDEPWQERKLTHLKKTVVLQKAKNGWEKYQNVTGDVADRSLSQKSLCLWSQERFS